MIRSFSNVPAFKKEIDVINGRAPDENRETKPQDYSFRIIMDNHYSVKCKKVTLAKVKTKPDAREFCLKHYLKEKYNPITNVPENFKVTFSGYNYLVFDCSLVEKRWLYKCRNMKDALVSIHYYQIFGKRHE